MRKEGGNERAPVRTVVQSLSFSGLRAVGSETSRGRGTRDWAGNVCADVCCTMNSGASSKVQVLHDFKT